MCAHRQRKIDKPIKNAGESGQQVCFCVGTPNTDILQSL